MDLYKGHHSKQEYEAIKRVLMGSSRKVTSAVEERSSVEEQVAALINHATDTNILARSWQGWQPWV